MTTQSLSGAWQMRRADEALWHEAQVPGSVYADLMRDGTLPDPFWRENETQFFELMRHSFVYRRTFTADPAVLGARRQVLRCFGLDTLAHVRLNGTPLGDADNMHITWAWEVGGILRAGENELEIAFDSPIEYCLAAYDRSPGWGSTDAIPGFGHMRKAHMMFGWDWGPRLPDAGIWREIRLEGIDRARLDSVRVDQCHHDGRVTLTLAPDIEGDADACRLRARLIAPSGEAFPFRDGTLTVEEPELWWPRGYGAQPLYTVEVELWAGDTLQDSWRRRIGLRTLSVSREKDQWGEEFCHIVNGVRIFAMGGDYIPEDNIYARITPERTRRLLSDAALANFNTIRVWGGGYYPDDFFFDICDELGLLVWLDLMFACSFYDLTEEFDRSIRTEAAQNVRRVRHHASLALICGNNEMETFMAQTETSLVTGGEGMRPARRSHVADYIKMYEYVLPGVVRREAPQTFWWPSSPSSGGSFEEPNSPDRGDVHYWDVWHGEKPFTEYRKFFFRYASEFGFQSFPCLATVESFTEPEDRNIFSRIMERHQRNKDANGKILSYLSQTYRYPLSFDGLLYASQLLQAEAIRYGVEHWRRNRGRCMGAIIWQLNDCWPVASWASIDYYGRWKAMHYAAKRFFAPVLLSVHEEGEISQNPKINEFCREPLERSARMSVANETMETVRGTVRWALRAPDASVLREGSMPVEAAPLSSVWLEKIDFPGVPLTEVYFTCELEAEGRILSRATALFCAPKHFAFRDPRLTGEVRNGVITVRADAFASYVCIESEDPDLLLEDNYFDLHGDARSVRILRGSAEQLRLRSVYDLGRE